MAREKYNSVAKWFGGLVSALGIAAYGVSVLATGQATFRGRYGGVLELSGFDAFLYGLCVLSFAAAIHFLYFWGNSERLYGYAPIGASAGLLIFFLTLGVIVVRQFLNFI